MSTKLYKLEYEYVFKDGEELIQQINEDIISIHGSNVTYEYEIYEIEDKIIIEYFIL